MYNTINKSNLSTEQSTLLNNTYKSFLRNGANLSEEKKNKIRDIDIKLSKLSLDFGQNLLKETNDFELLVSDIKKLEGLSDDHIEAAKMLAESKNKKGWLFTLDYPSYVPFVIFRYRLLRKEITIAFGQRGFKNNEFDYSWLITWANPELKNLAWLAFIPIIVIIVSSVWPMEQI